MEDLSLREKIGQTVIFRQSLLERIGDVEAYFTQNPIGASWVMGHSKELYRAVEERLGNPGLKGKRDEVWTWFLVRCGWTISIWWKRRFCGAT